MSTDADSISSVSELDNSDWDPDFHLSTGASDTESDTVKSKRTVSSNDSDGVPETDESSLRNERSNVCDFVPETDESSVASDVYPLLSSCPSPEQDNSITSSSPIEESKCTVLTSDKAKKWPCLFCKRKQAKLPRHLKTQHGDEESVKEYMNCKDKKEQEILLLKIRNLGSHLHNKNVLKQGKGSLVVSHSPSPDAPCSPTDYVPCPTCFGYFKENLLYKHHCPLQANPKRKGSSRVKLGKILLSTRGLEGKREEFVAFLHTLRGDPVALVAKNDKLILDLAELEFDKHGYDVDQHNDIRCKMRSLARLVVELRRVTNQASAFLEDFICPEMVKTVILATQNISGYQPATQTYTHPSLANKLGTALKTCAMLHKGSGVERHDPDVEKKAAQFVEMLDMRWNSKVSRHAHRTLDVRKRNKPCLLPLAEDIVKLSASLQEKARDNIKVLESNPSCTPAVIEAWSLLSAVFLTQCILFNRRRQGEVAKMKVADYENHMNGHDAETVMDALSPLEKELCKHLTRIEVQGKRNRTVPILLTTAMKRSLEVLMNTRSKSGVAEENTFLFPRTKYNSLGHKRGSDCLRDLVHDCGADHPEWVTSTKLRKQIGTLSQVVNLKDHEMDILADFMGHDIRIHRTFYRLPERALQAAKISKLLFALEKGTISSFSGKSLDEVTVTLEDNLEEEPDESNTAPPLSCHKVLPSGSSPPLSCHKVLPAGSSQPLSCHKVLPSGSSQPLSCHKVLPLGSPQPLSRRKVLPSDCSPPLYCDEVLSSDDEAWEPNGAAAVKRKAGNQKGKGGLRNGAKRHKWGDNEKAAVIEHFAVSICNGKLPGKMDIEKLLAAEPLLHNRSWKNVKDCLRNEILKRKGV